MVKHRGAYLGTEIDERWWKRYRKDGLFMRGSGECWLDDGALRFRRYGTRQPISIPYGAIGAIKVGTWHAGKWAMGRPILKIIWRKDDLRLSSGFLVGGGKDATMTVRRLLAERSGR